MTNLNTGPRYFCQERWGGHIFVTRERKYGRTIAAGSYHAVLAACGLLRGLPMTRSYTPPQPCEENEE